MNYLERKRTHSIHVMDQQENGNSNGNGRPPAIPKLESNSSPGDGENQADTSTAEESDDCLEGADALEQYRFIRLIRSQLLQAKPFSNVEEYNANVLKNKKFKRVYDNMNYHYRQLMTILDNLSTDARSITETYRENVWYHIIS